MNPRNLLWLLLAAVVGGAALSYFTAGLAVSEATTIQRPNTVIDSPPLGTPAPPATGARPARPGADPQAPAGEKLSGEEVLELSQPGEHHEHLDRLAGDWDLTIRVWSSPDGEPTESAGTAEARWILDGRFLWTIYRAELLGQPFEAWSIEGYDNRAQRYLGTWRDTQGTYTLIYTGKCQLPPQAEGEEKVDKAQAQPMPDGRYRVMNTSLTDPASGERLNVRTELQIPDDGSFIQESFVMLPARGARGLGPKPAEDAIKNLEIVGRRRGG